MRANSVGKSHCSLETSKFCTNYKLILKAHLKKIGKEEFGVVYADREG